MKNKKIKVSKPLKYDVVEKKRGHTVCRRSDGFMVYLDTGDSLEEKAVNKIRLGAEQETVILAVGLLRFSQIIRNYSRIANKDVQKRIEEKSRKILQSIIGNAFISTEEFPMERGLFEEESNNEN